MIKPVNNIAEIMAYPKEVAARHHLEAFIAGGYLRDTLLNKPVKDIDVFMIPARLLDFDMDEALLLAHDENMEVDMENVYETIDNTINDDICMVANKVVGNIRYPYNFIFLNQHVSPQAVLDSFDFGICQIGIDENMEVITTPEFWKDSLDKTYTLLKWRSEERKKFRIAKMSEKFFDYKFVEKHDGSQA